MINEIGIMIELQHYWDNVMRCDMEIQRFNRSINTWEKSLNDLTLKLNKKDTELKDLKLQLKKNELDLEEIESKSLKIEQRKNQLKSEREIEAQNNELILLHERKDKLENIIIEMIEKVDISEKEIIQLKNEKDGTTVQVNSDITLLKNKISEQTLESEKFRKQFEDQISSLSPQIKSKFIKLTGSKDGVAIAKLNGDTCSHCNFKVPSALAVSASGRKSIETCTNCGRFIY